jgi:hypothetical protein
MATIYFVSAEPSGPIKIGVTEGSPAARLYSLQTGSPVPLKLMGVVRGVERQYESALHERFRHLRMHGEWFARGGDLVQFIADRAESDVASTVLAPARKRPRRKAERRGRIRVRRMTGSRTRGSETDPAELRAILALKKAKWPNDEICRALGMSRRSLFRRLAEIRRLKAEAEERGEYPSDD